MTTATHTAATADLASSEPATLDLASRALRYFIVLWFATLVGAFGGLALGVFTSAMQGDLGRLFTSVGPSALTSAILAVVVFGVSDIIRSTRATRKSA